MTEAAVWASAGGWLNPANLGQLVVNVLAVAGGAAVGAFGSGWLLRLISRWLSARPAPKWAVQGVRVLGGITLAVLVGLFVFGSGGGRFGLGGDGGGFFGAGKGDATGPTGREGPTGKEAAPTASDPVATGGELRVEVLGGANPSDVLFRVQGKQERHTPEQLIGLLAAGKGGQPPLTGLTLVIYKDSPSADVPQVQQVRKWAKEHGLAVSTDEPPDPRNSP